MATNEVRQHILPLGGPSGLSCVSPTPPRNRPPNQYQSPTMMNAMRSFASAARFPKSVCNALIDGLDSRLVPIFRRNYPDHAVLHDLSASYQRGKFQDILRAMQMAEDEVNSISEIACSTVNGQAFHADALVHASQAERTLSRYHGGDGYTSEEGTSGGYRSDGGRSATSNDSRLGRRDRCFGCNGPHLWIVNGVIVCENADKRVSAQPRPRIIKHGLRSHAHVAPRGRAGTPTSRCTRD